jgi:ubiquinone/menaquinone biosynthesis C-methylase UbiE
MREQKEESNLIDTANFESAYQGKPPWDIGRPQKEYIGLEQAGEIVESVLDVGCGTGENALYLAAQGHEVWGIDFTPVAIRKAQEKAAQRHLTATFRVLNVFELHTLERTFDTVIDSGFFHVLSDEERPLFVDNLAAVIRRGGTYFMLSLSELTPKLDYSNVKDFIPDIDKLKQEDYSGLMGRWAEGPRRVTQAEIKELFRDGWRINYIRQATMEGTIEPYAVQGWLSSISKE